MPDRPRRSRHPGIAAACLVALLWAQAEAGTGKLPLTGAVTTVEGAAGGGLSPWAVIGSNATRGELGVSATVSRLNTRDYGLTVQGLALGVHDRVELSLARQDFDAAPAVALNGVAPFGVRAGEHLRMDVTGVKLRLAGDAILDSDTWMPQVAVGLQHKALHPGSIGPVLQFLGARTQGTDIYISATKLWLAGGVLLNGTLRSTRANQNGLLGFGAAAPGHDGRSLQAEWSAALLLRRDLAVGAEYRFKPNNLQALGAAAGLGDALREQDWRDVFIAWAPGRHFSLTLARVDLGQVLPGITARRRQSGYYLSGQAAF